MNLDLINKNPILKHSFEFALLADAYTAHFYELRRYDLARQLFRSSTSIGANIFESQHAESKQDFIHKLKISAKEASETNFWLLICQNRNGYPPCDHLLAKLDEINRLLSSIISSSKKSNPATYFWVSFLMFAQSIFSITSSNSTTGIHSSAPRISTLLH